MRVRTTITLPKELLARIDRAGVSRSRLLEQAALYYLAALEKAASDRRDEALLEANADRLNREAADVLEYQNQS